MRRENSFSDNYLIGGMLTDSALNQGVKVRPHVNGVVVHVAKSFNGVSAKIDGDKHDACFPTLVSLLEELTPTLKIGTYRYLWYKNPNTKDADKLSTVCIKKALTSDACDKGFLFSPLTYRDEPFDCESTVDCTLPESDKHRLLKWNAVKDAKDFNKKIKAIYSSGYQSAVVKVGKRSYRITKIEEETFPIVGFTESKRWNEVSGVLVSVPGLTKPVEVKRGLTTQDKRDMYNSPEEFLNRGVIILHEGITTTRNLRNVKVRALRVTILTP